MSKLTTYLLTGAAASALFVTLPGDQTAQAATWHAGTPKALRGHWHGRMTKTQLGHGKYIWNYSYITISKRAFAGRHTQFDAWGAQHPKYRKLGPNAWVIKGKYITPIAYTVRKCGARAITIKGHWQGATTSTFAKFSGRMNRHTFYPIY